MHYANSGRSYFKIHYYKIIQLYNDVIMCCQNVDAEMAKNVRVTLEMLLTCLFCVYLEVMSTVHGKERC